MYVVPHSYRIYAAPVLFLCSAVFSSSALGSAIPDPLGRIASVATQPNSLTNVSLANTSQFVNSAGRISTATPAANGALSARVNYSIASQYGRIPMSAVVTYSRAAAVGALRGCLASGPACLAGATVGAGVGLGVEAFIGSSGYAIDDQGNIVGASSDSAPRSGTCYQLYNGASGTSACSLGPGQVGFITTPVANRGTSIYDFARKRWPDLTSLHQGICNRSSSTGVITCSSTAWSSVTRNGQSFYQVGYTAYYPGTYNSGERFYVTTSPASSLSEVVNDISAGQPVDFASFLANLNFDSYIPDSTDLAIIGDRILNRPAEIIEIDPIAPLALPSTTETFNLPGGGTQTRVSTSTLTSPIYANGTANPRIGETLTTETVTYDENSNIVDSGSSVTDNTPPAANPDNPNGTGSVPNTPTGCTLFKPFCDFADWFMILPDEEEPDLSVLKKEFESDTEEFSLNLGSGSCPAPISLNLGFINKVVEVSYQPFCDFATTIRPFILAAAYLLSAYMYIGALRRA